MDHLLAMPLNPLEIALAKVWANALVITAAVGLSLVFIVDGLLRIPIAGYARRHALPILRNLCRHFLTISARSMPQLYARRVAAQHAVGANTPLESMPCHSSGSVTLGPELRIALFNPPSQLESTQIPRLLNHLRPPLGLDEAAGHLI
jgi:ABC-2 type transport system permease protein